MRRRATRPNVFRGLKRFGVYSTDWKFILIPTAIAYLVPFVLGLWVGYVPLGFPVGLLVFLILLGIIQLPTPEQTFLLAFSEVRRRDRPMGDVSTTAPRRDSNRQVGQTSRNQEISMDIANLSFTQIAISLFGGLLSVGLGSGCRISDHPGIQIVTRAARRLDRGSRKRRTHRSNAEAVGYCFRPRSRGWTATLFVTGTGATARRTSSNRRTVFTSTEMLLNNGSKN